MRLTPGKIYLWGGLSMLFLTLWNHQSTHNLRSIVDSVKEERLREAAELRHRSMMTGSPPSTSPIGDKADLSLPPPNFNPFYTQQQAEAQSYTK